MKENYPTRLHKPFRLASITLSRAGTAAIGLPTAANALSAGKNQPGQSSTGAAEERADNRTCDGLKDYNGYLIDKAKDGIDWRAKIDLQNGTGYRYSQKAKTYNAWTWYGYWDTDSSSMIRMQVFDSQTGQNLGEQNWLGNSGY